MNLVEISDHWGRPVGELKDILLEKFDRIVLSEYSQLDERILRGLTDYLEVYEDAHESKHKRLAKYSDDDQFETLKNPTLQKGEINSGNKKIEQLVGDSHIDVMFPEDDRPVLNKHSSAEEQCLRELNGIESPAVGYTKKLINFCMNNKYLVFIDTCSLLNNHFYDFYHFFIEAAKESHTLYVPYVVLEELKNILQKKEKEKDILRKAEDRIYFIAEQCRKNKMKIVGDENDKRTNERGEKVIHADRILIEKLIYFRNDSKNCLLITQDYGVTVDALKQNDWQSTKSRAQILVKKIGKRGVLVDNSEDVSNPKLPID